MIERFIYGKQLPAFYEIQLSAGKGSDEPLVVMAQSLDNSGLPREEILTLATMEKERREGVPIDYSLRLMRPAETRKFMIPRLRKAFREAVTQVLIENTPVRHVADLAVRQVALLEQYDLTTEA